VNPGLQAEIGDSPSDSLQLGDTVDLQGSGVWTSGTIQEHDDEKLLVRLFTAKDEIAQVARGSLFEVQRGIEAGVLIANLPLVRYDTDARLIQLKSAHGKLRVERRQHSRVPVRVRACVLHDRRLAPEIGYTVNLAGGGAAVDLAESEMLVGDLCDIWLRIPDGPPVQVRARLMGNAPYHRFQFWNLDPPHEERLLRFLLKEESEQRRLLSGARR
jgi:PilZ domain